MGEHPSRMTVVSRAHRIVRRGDSELSLPTALRKSVERTDAQITWLLQMQMPEKAATVLARRQALLASWPTAIVDVSHQHVQGDPCRQSQIGAAVATLIESYPVSMQPTLEAFVAHMRHNVFAQSPRRAQAYLQGAAGTGKTRFVHELAGVLQLPLVVIKLPQSQQEDPVLKLLGPQSAYAGTAMFSSDGEDPCHSVGMLACSLFEAEILNPIVFIDEAGEVLNNLRYAELLKDVLDPDNLALRLRGLYDLRLDFSRATVVLAGNAFLEDAALKSKLKQIVFEPLTRTQKSRILRDTVWDEVYNNNARLRPTIRQALAESMDRFTPILMEIERKRQVPGARHLIEGTRELSKFVAGRLSINRDVTNTEARALVESFYDQRDALNGDIPRHTHRAPLFSMEGLY